MEVIIIIYYLKNKIKQAEHEKLIKQKEISTLINELSMKMNDAKNISIVIDEKITVQLDTIKELSKTNENLKNDVEKLSELKKLSEKETNSIGYVFTRKMDEFRQNSRKENIIIALFFFLLGVFVTLIKIFFQQI